ncbi:MAG: PQQ-dependent sugar dehydrogenase [Candidatus Eisenbacteria bacterium]|nr:PQQ-dependent sugar dehydrogenase [Candidatus Eisenbacteria bacterium]
MVENVAPGAVFTVPTGLAYMPGGRLLVAEKRGRVYFITNGVKSANPLWSAETEILNETDRGLLDVAVDPNYVTNHYVYFLYTVDPDTNGVDTNNNGFGRLTRYQVSFTDSTALVPGSRTILMGIDWPHGPLSDSPSHTIGSLRWGNDGSLLVSVGDGAQYDQMDAGGLDPSAYGPGKTSTAEDIGAFRAQWIDCLPGKILRINPANGHGYASNPFVNGDLTSVRSRIFDYGLRNPFRFTVRPGTGSADTTAGNPGVLYVGDVGWSTWEEMDIGKTPGLNFGWPCYEGFASRPDYQSATPAHNDCASVGTSSNPSTPTPPVESWNHTDASVSSPFQFTGNTSIGGVFYTGTNYPAGYQNQYFFADYGQNWIKVAIVDGSNNLTNVLDFGSSCDGPVCLITEPGTGNIIYTAILTGEIRRIRYTGATGNQPPVVVVSATPNAGGAPLTVNFSSVGTLDPDGDPMTYQWLFGDGQGSTSPNPTHTYTIGGSYPATLTVFDNHGGQTTQATVVEVMSNAAFPGTPVLDNFNRANGALGPNWTGTTTGLSISSNRLVQSSGTAFPVWAGGAFGPDQEAYVTMAATSTTAPGQDLLLKIQGTDPTTNAQLEVRFDATQQHIWVSTYSPGNGGWNTWLTIPSVTFSAGDRFGARAFANGTVQVFRNTTLIGTTSIQGWAFSASSGSIGMTLDLASAAAWDDFGGGSFVLNPNTKPHGIILSPAAGAFYSIGDTLQFSGTATDAQDPPSAIAYHWWVDLHHNNHIHPQVFAADGATASFVTQQHDDGTGCYYQITLVSTDTGSLADTTSINVFPNVDLQPSPSYNTPGMAGTTTPTTFHFKIYNHGTVGSPFTHWIVVGGTTMLTEGDAQVAAGDSVQVDAVAQPVLGPGTYPLRVVVDTLNICHETDETNNASMGRLTVISGAGTVDVPSLPTVFRLGPVEPNPGPGAVAFALDLPAEARVTVTVHDLLGRRVASQSERVFGAGRWTLGWDGRNDSGAEAPNGIYLARITVNGRSWVRRVMHLR